MTAKGGLSETSLVVGNISILLMSKDHSAKKKKKKTEDLSELFSYLSAEAKSQQSHLQPRNERAASTAGLKTSSCRIHLTGRL